MMKETSDPKSGEAAQRASAATPTANTAMACPANNDARHSDALDKDWINRT
jgi:hypothetical protein